MGMGKGSMLAVAALCVALLIAGCGGDGDDTTSSSTASGSTTAPAQAPEKVDAETTEQAEALIAAQSKPKIKVPSGPPPKQIQARELLPEGEGPKAKKGDEVTVQYVGVGYKSKQEFDTSWGGQPFTFTLGSGMVIPGWELGVEGMTVGSRRELILPPEAAYGPAGSPPNIGPNETLIFVIDLLSVN